MVIVFMVEKIDNDLAHFAVDVGVVSVHMGCITSWTWCDASHLDGTTHGDVAGHEDLKQ